MPGKYLVYKAPAVTFEIEVCELKIMLASATSEFRKEILDFLVNYSDDHPFNHLEYKNSFFQ